MDKDEIRKRARELYEDELQFSIARDDQVDLIQCRSRAAMRLGRELENQDISGVWLGYIEGIARSTERGFEIDLTVGEIRVGGTLRTGVLKVVPADKAREADLIEWYALREAKLDEFVAKRQQERPFVAEIIDRMRAHGGDPTLLEACPDLFGHEKADAA